MATIFNVLILLKQQLCLGTKEENASSVRYFFDKIRDGGVPIKWDAEFQGVSILPLVLEIIRLCKNINKSDYFLLILKNIPSTFHWTQAIATQFFQYAKQYIGLTEYSLFPLVKTVINSSNQILMHCCLCYLQYDVRMGEHMDLAMLLRLQCNRLLYSVSQLSPLLWNKPYFGRLTFEVLPYMYSSTEHMIVVQSCYRKLESKLPKDIVQHQISLFLVG